MSANNDKDWETIDVDVERPVRVVISARFPKELADEVFREARQRGLTTSVFVRQALEAYLEAGAGATSDVSISSHDTSVTWYAGRSHQGRTASAPARVESRVATG